MNAATVRKHLIGMGIPDEGFIVKGERYGDLRHFTITILDRYLQRRAFEIKQAVLALIVAKGFGGNCDVVLQGIKLA